MSRAPCPAALTHTQRSVPEGGTAGTGTERQKDSNRLVPKLEPQVPVTCQPERV